MTKTKTKGKAVKKKAAAKSTKTVMSKAESGKKPMCTCGCHLGGKDMGHSHEVKRSAKRTGAKGASTAEEEGSLEKDALAFVQAARDLSNARKSKSMQNIVEALDENLQLWIGMKTLVSSPHHPLADETKTNLIRLADYIVANIVGKHGKLTDAQMDSIVNANLQVAEGLMECAENNRNENEIEALTLIESSIQLYDAKEPNASKAQIAKALEENFAMWLKIKTLVKSPESELPPKLKVNVLKVADFVAATTLKLRAQFDRNKLGVLANMNLQIAEGLLEGNTLTQPQYEAFVLLSAAVDMANAKEKNDKVAMTNALYTNLQIWTAIKSFMKSEPHHLGAAVRQNLLRLAEYNAAKTIELGRAGGMDEEKLDAIINSNLQVSEGLLERDKSARLQLVI
ncbi:MAG: hypothetical protein FWF01_03310 [Alphaproteobacteria bacterium]|nr:hypothetical protein [Alphaproteobacteria bacterium]